MSNATNPRPLTRTSSVRVTVACPTWCTCEPEAHIPDLEQLQACLHLSAEQSIADTTTGPGRNPSEGDHPADPVTVRLATLTYLDGRETDLATIYLNGAELSVPQAAEVSAALAGLVEQHRQTVGAA